MKQPPPIRLCLAASALLCAAPAAWSQVVSVPVDVALPLSPVQMMVMPGEFPGLPIPTPVRQLPGLPAPTPKLPTPLIQDSPEYLPTARAVPLPVVLARRMSVAEMIPILRAAFGLDKPARELDGRKVAAAFDGSKAGKTPAAVESRQTLPELDLEREIGVRP